METVLLAPALALLVAAAWSLLTWASWSVDVQDAAAAGAHAALAGRPVRPAVAAALPPSLRGGLRVTRARGRVTVRVRAQLPVAGSLGLESSAAVVGQ